VGILSQSLSTSAEKVPPRESGDVLQIRNLQVIFQKTRGILVGRKSSEVRAIDNLTLDLHRSEVLSVVGESGSGKTTLLRCIMKLQNPTSGSIVYNGVDLAKIKGGRALLGFRREVQMVFQDPYECLNPRETVYSMVSMPIRYLLREKDESKIERKVRELLLEVRLKPTETLDKFAHQLSGGERQRVNIAKALAPDPKVLLLDEPITMLDAAQRINVLHLLNELRKKRDLTLLLITHDLASSKVISDRIVVMYLGKVVETGPVREVLSKPYHPYVELIRESMPSLKSLDEERPAEASATVPRKEIFDESVNRGCIFRPRCRYATETCKTVDPILEEKSSSRLAACHNPLSPD
jgi:oligopeptide/dipeptide ABC transporter ATP-binding protein